MRYSSFELELAPSREAMPLLLPINLKRLIRQLRAGEGAE